MRLIKIIFFVNCLFAYIGCALSIKKQTDDSTIAGPFAIKIINEEFDGDVLKTKVLVVLNEELGQRVALIKLRPLNNGQVIEEVQKELTILDFAKSRELQLDLSVNAKGMTDYQLEFLWSIPIKQKSSIAQPGSSSDVQQYVEKTSLQSNPISAAGVIELPKVTNVVNSEIRNLKILRQANPCTPEGCYETLTLEGDLYNLGNFILKKAVLAVKTGTSEERVEVNNISILPNAFRSIKLTLDNLPVNAATNPSIRVVEDHYEAR